MKLTLPLLAIATFALGAPLLATTSVPAGDPISGARQFIYCKACHTVTQGGANTVGPNLWGIVGVRAATRPGFAYSAALKGAGIVWTPDQLDAFLARPIGKVPGTKMAFAGMRNPAARRDLIAYLATLRKK